MLLSADWASCRFDEAIGAVSTPATQTGGMKLMSAWQFLHHLKRRVTCPVLTVVGEHGVNLTVLAEMLFILVGFCCCLTASPANEPVETDVRIGFSSISDHVPRVPINLLLLVPLFSEKGGGWTRLDLTQSSMVTPSSRWIKKVSWIVSVKVKCESLEVVTNKPNPLNVYSLFTEVRSKLINIGLFCLALKLTHPPHIFSSYVHEQVGIMRLSTKCIYIQILTISGYKASSTLPLSSGAASSPGRFRVDTEAW